ncbi:NAD-dependent succinate-semialdehyde dehydrogenase [Mesorhizobium sp. CN2-181]|uniref:NAD-dependent succinate-semialdehyde dehydrogenase n=1 Tax=Mesorhizobium yinganensis TaxID=3157707 RepID=UPI0032B7EF1A
MFESINPANGELLASFAQTAPQALERALDGCVRAQRNWADSTVVSRGDLLKRLASVLRVDVDRLSRLITLEMGKPLAEAEGEVLKCARCCEYYAENAERFLAPEFVASGASRSYVVLDPIGVVLAIMPWNFPLWQFFRFAAPSIVAGNGILLKHASNVPQCAQAIESLMEKAGAPAGLVRNLFVHHSQVQSLIDDQRIAALTLTGSTAVGSLVASQAGRALKKQVLELGGSDPFIVLADADVGQAAQTAVKARFTNTGQSCVCAKRFIVDDSIADEFVAAMVGGIKRLKVGDPLDRTNAVGPMARDNLRGDLQSQVDRSVEAGAKLAVGGGSLGGDGYFFEPTLLDHVTPDMPVFKEETFGPVAAVIRVGDADEAIELANTSEFGLGAALWTKDLSRAERLARRIEAGAVFINGMVASDPRLPFGGIKKSGYGRELGIHGLREFTNVKTVWIGPAQQ